MKSSTCKPRQDPGLPKRSGIADIIGRIIGHTHSNPAKSEDHVWRNARRGIRGLLIYCSAFRCSRWTAVSGNAGRMTPVRSCPRRAGCEPNAVWNAPTKRRRHRGFGGLHDIFSSIRNRISQLPRGAGTSCRPSGACLPPQQVSRMPSGCASRKPSPTLDRPSEQPAACPLREQLRPDACRRAEVSPQQVGLRTRRRAARRRPSWSRPRLSRGDASVPYCDPIAAIPPQKRLAGTSSASHCELVTRR